MLPLDRARDGFCWLFHNLLCSRNFWVCPCFVHFSTHANVKRSNVLGGNFSLVGAPSIGASGAIFGTVAVSCKHVWALRHLMTLLRLLGWIFSLTGNTTTDLVER